MSRWTSGPVLCTVAGKDVLTISRAKTRASVDNDKDIGTGKLSHDSCLFIHIYIPFPYLEVPEKVENKNFWS